MAGPRNAIQQFFKTTTLHGFKYFLSPYYFDRLAWLLGCCASASCAGILCAALWARFLQVPALLTLQSAITMTQPMPMVGVCLPHERTAKNFLRHLGADTDRLVTALAQVLKGKPANNHDLLSLNQLLKQERVVWSEIMYDHTPPCQEMVKKCRWQNSMRPCSRLFDKQIGQTGVCCFMTPTKLHNINNKNQNYNVHKLSLALQCYDGTVPYDCEFFTKYDAEDFVKPVTLTPGLDYVATVTFTSLHNFDAEKLVDSQCVSDADYSRRNCLTQCIEKECGCSDPLRLIEDNERNVPPACSITKFSCLKTSGLDDDTCKCLPSCKKITSDLILEHRDINMMVYTIDPFYRNINITSTAVLHIQISILTGSRIFTHKSSESWLTLLSSLGGVFNMFLGVGLFSALELIFLLLVKLPIAIKK